jgi:hypothetical protein
MRNIRHGAAPSPESLSLVRETLAADRITMLSQYIIAESL